jgi:hypothetical protein
MSRQRSPQPPDERDAAPSPELQHVLQELQSPDEWTRANAVRTLCPCRRKDWGEPVYRYVVAMRDDPSPVVRGAVHHDLTENRCWNETWEARLIQERRARKIKVTVAAKAVALADLCEQLRAETGVPLFVEGGVADEKVTILCREMPLRTVMRQLSRSLGYAWEWRKKAEAGRLELIREPQAPGPQKGEPSARRMRDHLMRARLSLSLFGYERGRWPEAAGWGSATKVTSADLLEALHRASGMPIIGDYYTRLVTVDTDALADRPLRELLDQVATAARMKWEFADGEWLQFRSVWGHFEQLQEVPNRLLSRWAASRRRHGYLPLEALIEIAGLSADQRASAEMAEGAREIWELAEWSLATTGLPEHLRFLAGFSPAERERATSGEGLPFLEMSCSQQQRFLSLASGGEARLSPEAGASLRVEYRPWHAAAGARQEARLSFCYQFGGSPAGAVRFIATEGSGGSGRPPWSGAGSEEN